MPPVPALGPLRSASVCRSTGVVCLAGSVWFHLWLMVPLMALLVPRAAIALSLARKASRRQPRMAGDHADAHVHSDS